MSGFGSQPFGSSPYGIGTPAVAERSEGKIHQDAFTGASLGSRHIDPRTRDYVLANGRIAGMNDTKHLVLMAVTTAKGSSAMRALGHEFWRIDRITANIQARVENTLRGALQHLIDQEIIELIEVTVEPVRPGVVLARLRWFDLVALTDDETSTEIGSG